MIENFEKSIFCVSLIILLLLLPSEGLCQQDPPHNQCCIQIYIAGLFLGEANSLARYSIISDAEIITNLFEAGNAIEVANTLCSAENEAWPRWRALQGNISTLANRLAAEPDPKSREEIIRSTDGYREGFATRLRKMTVRDSYERKIIPKDTCAANYFRIAYFVGFAHHAFHVASEGGPFAKEAKRLGLERMAQLLASINKLKTVRPWTGYCVELWRPDFIIPRIRAMFQVSPPPSAEDLVNLAGEVKGLIAEALQSGNPDYRVNRCPGTNQIGTEKGRLWTRQGFLWDREVLNAQLQTLNESLGRVVPSVDYTLECIKEICPVCDPPLGVFYSKRDEENCEACKKAKHTEIKECARKKAAQKRRK